MKGYNSMSEPVPWCEVRNAVRSKRFSPSARNHKASRYGMLLAMYQGMTGRNSMLETLNGLLEATYDFDDANHGDHFAALAALHETARPVVEAIKAEGVAQCSVWADDLLTMNTDGMQMRIEQIAARLGLI